MRLIIAENVMNKAMLVKSLETLFEFNQSKFEEIFELAHNEIDICDVETLVDGFIESL